MVALTNVSRKKSLHEVWAMKCGAKKSQTQPEVWIVVRWETFSRVLVL